MLAHARKYAFLSIGASLLTMALKFGAFFLTGSVGLLSDAVESVVNLTAGLIALMAIILAHRPADQSHAYGHGKVEYFSSGMEGILICVAALGIAYASVQLEFKTPLFLPARASLWAARDEHGADFEVRNARGDKPHLRGRVSY